MHVQLQYKQRITVNRQQGMIRAQDRRVQAVAADIPPAYDRSHRVPVGTGPFRPADISGDPVVRIFSAYRQHCLGSRGSVHSSDYLEQITVTECMQQLVAVMMQRKRDVRMGQRHPVHRIRDMPKLRLNTLHIFQPCRGVEE
ncbi:hypothetical protein D3C73_1110010 [compost metagenome]